MQSVQFSFRVVWFVHVPVTHPTLQPPLMVSNLFLFITKYSLFILFCCIAWLSTWCDIFCLLVFLFQSLSIFPLSSFLYLFFSLFLLSINNNNTEIFIYNYFWIFIYIFKRHYVLVNLLIKNIFSIIKK